MQDTTMQGRVQPIKSVRMREALQTTLIISKQYKPSKNPQEPEKCQPEVPRRALTNPETTLANLIHPQ